MATFPAPLPAHARWHDLRRAIVAAVAILLLILIARYIVQQTQQRKRDQAATSTRHAVPNFVATPRSYSDFRGRVVSANASEVVVMLSVTSETGTSSDKKYTVNVEPDTELKTVTDRVAQEDTVAALAMTDVKAGDLIHVFATSNLYSVDNFTATRIYKVVE